MPEPSGRELLQEWQQRMESVIRTAASAAGHADLPRVLVEPMQRQLQLLEELAERERHLERALAGRIAAPVDAVFDLLEESATGMRRQASALEAAGRALEETGSLVKAQAKLLEQTVDRLREPAEMAKSAAGLERRPHRDERRRR